MFAFAAPPERITAWPVNNESATVMLRVVPWIDRPVTVSPSTRMFDAPLNDSDIDTDAPGCGRIVTVETSTPSR